MPVFMLNGDGSDEPELEDMEFITVVCPQCGRELQMELHAVESFGCACQYDGPVLVLSGKPS